MHSADIGNCCLDLNQSIRWKEIVLGEFEEQTVEEIKLGLPPMFPDGLDTPVKRAKSQLGFINFVVAPFFKAMNENFLLPKPMKNLRMVTKFYSMLVAGEFEIDDYPGEEGLTKVKKAIQEEDSAGGGGK